MQKVLVSIVLLIVCIYCDAKTPEYVEREKRFLSLCETLDRPNIDCSCVARSHATYSHLSPSPVYEEYLFERYKQNIGLPNIADQTFQNYATGRDQQTVQIEMYNAFSEYESHDPFVNEVDGCVIPDAPPVVLADLPDKPIYDEVYQHRVNSSGTERYEQCVLVETSKILTPQELALIHFVYHRSVGENMIQNRLGVSLEDAQILAQTANAKYQRYAENTLEPGNYCMAMLRAEELSSGSIIQRYARSESDRQGAPIGLESIDISQPRPEIVDQFGALQAEIEQEVLQIQEEQSRQPSLSEVKNEMEQSKELKQATALKEAKPMSASESLIAKGCNGAGYSNEFCECFVSAFIDEMGEDKGAVALPIIADGISDAQKMSLMKSIDQTSYMQDMMQAQNIVSRCE